MLAVLAGMTVLLCLALLPRAQALGLGSARRGLRSRARSAATLPLRAAPAASRASLATPDPVQSESLIRIKNTHRKYPIDTVKVRAQVASIQAILGVADFQVDVWFCSDSKIRELNSEWREKNKSTDVLSFPANEFKSPGVFDYEADPTLQFEKHLGDIVISPAYVQRQSERDEKDKARLITDNIEDRGVSLAMSTTFALEERISLLLVHGMIHLLGYDHENTKDWKVMTKKEEEVMEKLGR